MMIFISVRGHTSKISKHDIVSVVGICFSMWAYTSHTTDIAKMTPLITSVTSIVCVSVMALKHIKQDLCIDLRSWRKTSVGKLFHSSTTVSIWPQWFLLKIRLRMASPICSIGFRSLSPPVNGFDSILINISDDADVVEFSVAILKDLCVNKIGMLDGIGVYIQRSALLEWL